MTTRLSGIVIVGAIVMILIGSGGEEIIIKMATLAPSGTTWMNVMQKMSHELLEKSDGQIKLRIYPGGVLGDEKDMFLKMQIGQLHSGAMTTVGLSLIQKEALVFQLPLLFSSHEEMDYVREKLLPRMEESFLRNGYILLGWGDVGTVYIFSKKRIQNKEELRKSKIWGWVDDQIAMALFREGGITPVYLSISEVLPSLQTGVIDTVPASPLACVALQWFSKVKYMTDLPLAISIGATVITEKQFDKMDASSQALLLDVAKRYHHELIHQIREDNLESIKTLRENRIEIVPVTDETKREWEEIALQVRKKLVGRLYSQQILDEVLRLVQEFRSIRQK